MNFQLQELDPIVVRRLGERHYYMDGVEDIPLSKNEINQLLYRKLAIPPEEIAFMHLEFQEKPQVKAAYFGINGTLLYCK